MIAESVFKDLKNWRRFVSSDNDIIRRSLEISPFLTMEIHTVADTVSDAVPIQRVLWQRRILPGITESVCPGTVRGRYTVEGTDWMPLLDEVALSLAWRFLNELTGKQEGFKIMEEKAVKDYFAEEGRYTSVEWLGDRGNIPVVKHIYPASNLTVEVGLCNTGSGKSYGPAYLRFEDGSNIEYNLIHHDGFNNRGMELRALGELEIDDLIKGLEFALTTLRDMRESRS